MTSEQFNQSLSNGSLPDSVSDHLISLWYDAKNDWHKAHTIIQDIEDKNAYWIHAYLHRKEGDNGNALYWYNRANKPMPDYSLQQEWEEIVTALL
jgi:hypothetical protein